ncbi:MAG: hypothetical protein M1540_01815 [Candidatus Bathyarchaeota archaeon]|nr:hypothetical protein [Chloroflexota bacterium]MCL5876533.1 hypothetical protein [Candidatus Bathyarchaeota archaeon]
MESTVAALLLVTSSVVFACIVIGYGVQMVQVSVSEDSAQMQLLDKLQDTIMNQTSTFNGTLPIIPDPTPTP